MSVDVSHIIRHGFRKVNDISAIKNFVFQTIEQQKEKLCLRGVEDVFRTDFDEEFHEYWFRVPYYDVEIYLHDGCWRIESYFSYHQLFMPYGDNFHIRRVIYDLARALGQSEAWHAAEYYTWNGDGLELAEQSFDRWLPLTKKRLMEEKGVKDIPEFNQ